MSTLEPIYDYDSWPDAAMGVGTIYSPVIDLRGYRGFTVQAVWTGTPTGSISIECSADDQAPNDWDTVADTTVAIAGAAGRQVYNLREQNYSFARVKYVGASGSGSIRGNITKK